MDLLPKVLKLLLGGEAIDGLEDGLGLAVEGLARDAPLLRLRGDGAVVPEEGGGGTGKALERGYDGQGGDLPGERGWWFFRVIPVAHPRFVHPLPLRPALLEKVPSRTG